MSDSPVEKAARGIYAQDFIRYAPGPPPFEAMAHEQQDRYRDQAQAVLTAVNYSSLLAENAALRGVAEAARVFAERHGRYHLGFWLADRTRGEGGRCDACTFCAHIPPMDAAELGEG